MGVRGKGKEVEKMTLHESIVKLFSEHANADRADRMEAYMKNLFPFYGIQSSLRKSLLKEYHAQIDELDKKELLNQMDELWNEKHRECQYAAGDILIRKKRLLGESELSRIENYIVTKSWWDTVDFLASHLIGILFQKYPHLIENNLNRWLESDNIWLNRTCLLFQLKYGQQTDFILLQKCIKSLDFKDEFFIQKAIGWSLRQYSKFNPDQVRNFVNTNQMTNLARREASKYI